LAPNLKYLIFSSHKDNAANMLRSLLYQLNIVGAVICETPQEVSGYLQQGVWPVIFIEHWEKHNLDALALYNILRQTPEGPFLSIFVTAGEGESHYFKYQESLALQGALTRPFIPTQAKTLLQNFSKSIALLKLQPVFKAIQYMNEFNYEKALPFLSEIKHNPFFAEQAYRCILHCEFKLKTQRQESPLSLETHWLELFKVTRHKLMILWEIIEYYIECNLYGKALKALHSLHHVDPRMTLKTMTYIELLFASGDYASLSKYLNELQKNSLYRDYSLECIKKFSLWFA
jgi:hypothetical protein